MKITEDVRKYAAEQAIDEGSAIERGLQEKAAEFQHSEQNSILNHDEWSLRARRDID